MINNSSLTLIPLGSMGWIPSAGMETTTFAFFWGNELIVIDAGTGLSRLLELRETLYKSEWAGLTQVRIFLTHYHLDHCTGLFWIKGIFGRIPVQIYAPGEEIYGRTAQEILDGLFQKPYSPARLKSFGPKIEVEGISLSGLMIENGPVPLLISARVNLNHSDPSVALRFGDYFAFVTDTPPEDEVAGFARGVDVLIHESWYDSSWTFGSMDDSLELHRDGPHTGSFGAGLVAIKAGIKRLYLMHHNPERKISDFESDAKKVSEKLGIECRASKDLEEILIACKR
jgi:ribonuclease BN (tRNA processing enzyme)